MPRAQILDPQSRPPFRPAFWAQERLLFSDAPEILYNGPLGSGKTRPMVEKADLRCRMHAGSRVALTRRFRTDLGISTLPPLLTKAITPAERAWGWRPGADGGSTLFYPNGSSILCVGMDDPGKLLSADFDLIIADQCEQFEEEHWNGGIDRLRHVPAPYVDEGGVEHEAYRQMVGGCNAADPGHFLYSRFEPDRGSHLIRSTEPLEMPDGSTIPVGTVVRETLIGSIKDNLANLPPDYVARIMRHKGRHRARYVENRWIPFEGVVYDCWEPNVHCLPRPDAWAMWRGLPPPTWPRHRAIDFGYVNPFVCQWWAEDPDGGFWMYREIYMTRRTVPQNAQQINELEAAELQTLQECAKNLGRKDVDYYPYGMTVSDHDSGDRALLEEAGITTDAAEKEVSPGIQTVYDLLAPFEKDGERISRLKFISDALVEKDEELASDKRHPPTCTIEEIPRYKLKPYRSASAQGPREEPLKKDDHGCDAMRYLFRSKAVWGDMEFIRL